MKAIQTKFLGATDTKPSRIKASAEGVKSEIFHRGELQKARIGDDSEHTTAAKLFAAHNNWPTNLASGGLSNPDVWVHCFLPKELKEAAQALGAAIENGDPQEIGDLWLYQVKPLIS
jgi:hypothetical protein